MAIDFIDREDWKKLMGAVLRSAMEDVVRLAHPAMRQKSYLHEAYLDAVDMFWDPTYRMTDILDDEGEPMGIENLLTSSIGNDLVEVSKLQEHLVEQIDQFWDEKKFNSIKIPDSFVIEGQPWRVLHHQLEEYALDFDEHILYMDRAANDEESQQQFFYAVTDILFDKLDIRLARKQTRQLARAIFKMLKINSCFLAVTQIPKST